MTPYDTPKDRRCGKTDAVLALYLDGDIGDGDIGGGDIGGTGSAEDSGFELACTDSLANHLRDCGQCQQSLQRARRLDAVLAEGAGRAMATAQTSGAVDRLLAGAEAGTDDVVLAPDSNVPEPHQLERAIVAPTLLLLAAAAGLLLLLGTGPDQHSELPRPEIAPATVQTTVQTTVQPTAQTTAQATAEADPTPKDDTANDEPPATGVSGPAEILIAEDAAQRLRARSARRHAERRTDATSEGQLVRFRELAARVIEVGLPPDERAAAIRLLLQKSRPNAAGGGLALTRLVDTLATGRGEPELLAEALAGAAAEPHVTGYLRATLRRMESARAAPDRAGLAAVTVAARLGIPELDADVRRATRRHHDLLEVVAAATRVPFRSSGTAALLLACWSDADRRLDLDDAAMTQRLFAGQPQRVFDELVEELGAARSVARRVKCLLALACCPDRQNTAVLLDWATASCRREAYVAAWSLSQLPHAWLTEAAARALRQPSAFVLRAALARAGLPAAKAWTEPMRLTPRECTVLVSVSLPVFPQVAEWFRDGNRARSPIVDD